MFTIYYKYKNDFPYGLLFINNGKPFIYGNIW